MNNLMSLYNRKKGQNYNGLVLGSSGSGKSFSAKREMLDKYFDLQKHILLSERERLLARLGEIDKEIAGEEEEKDIEL